MAAFKEVILKRFKEFAKEIRKEFRKRTRTILRKQPHYVSHELEQWYKETEIYSVITEYWITMVQSKESHKLIKAWKKKHTHTFTMASLWIKYMDKFVQILLKYKDIKTFMEDLI